MLQDKEYNQRDQISIKRKAIMISAHITGFVEQSEKQTLLSKTPLTHQNGWAYTRFESQISAIHLPDQKLTKYPAGAQSFPCARPRTFIWEDSTDAIYHI